MISTAKKFQPAYKFSLKSIVTLVGYCNNFFQELFLPFFQLYTLMLRALRLSKIVGGKRDRNCMFNTFSSYRHSLIYAVNVGTQKRNRRSKNRLN